MIMDIVNIQGGLGNQMFCYAFGRWLENNGISVLYNVDNYRISNKGKSDAVHHGYELEKIFNIQIPIANENDYKNMLDESTFIFDRIRRRLLGTKKSYVSWYYLRQKKWFHPEFLKLKDVYFDGFWCSFKYADLIKDEIQKSFIFPEETNILNDQIKKQIVETQSVSIHIRHGDYLKLSDIYRVLDKKYYVDAINQIKNMIGDDIRFFCFSDDIEWCKKEFSEYNFTYIDWNQGDQSYRDMELMSLCKHNIIANSTFSMWGAWLNRNKDRIVIRPKWMYIKESDEWTDMWPDEWIAIENG